MDLKQTRRCRDGVLLGFLAAFSSLPMPAAPADEPPETQEAAPNRPVLKVDVRRDVETNYVPYRCAFITAGQEKFTFLVPEGYRVDTSDAAKVKLASPDFSGLIVLGISSGFPAGTKLEAETLRAWVVTNYSEVTIRGEKVVGANGQTGPALDFIWKTDSGVTRLTRTSFLPTAAGLMEFTVTASPEKFEASLHELNLVMLTFRSGVNGKFDYIIGSKYP